MATWIVNLFEKKSATEKDVYLIPYSMIADAPAIPDVSGKANLSGGNTFSGLQTINAPTNVSGSEQTTMEVKTSNGGSIIFGKEGANSGTMIRLDQADGTCRLRFRSSATAGAMVWEQPEQGAQLYVDLGKDGSDKHRVTFPSSAGTLALTSQINNGTLTIQQNGTKVQTFTANQSSSVTANITVPTKASDVNALSLDGGTINKSKTIKMDASANSDGANLKWGTVNSKNPYIGYASDQVDGTFVVGSLLGTNYASGLAIGGGSGNLLWKGTKVATTSDIPTKVSELTNDSGYTTNKGTVTQVKINGTTNSPDSAGLVDLGTVGGSSDNSKFDYTVLTNEDLNTVIVAGRYRAERGNTCAHNPIFGRPMPAFFLTVEKSGSGVVRQTAYVAEGIGNTYFQWYVRVSDDNGSSWAKWIEQQSMTGDYSQSFVGRKFFDNGIGISSSLQFSGDAGSSSQFAMSQGSSLAPKWVNLQVKVNGTIYTSDSDGLIDLGEISGGSASTSQYNDIY